MEEAHEPSTCEGWQRWLDVIKDMLPKFPKEGTVCTTAAVQYIIIVYECTTVYYVINICTFFTNKHYLQFV